MHNKIVKKWTLADVKEAAKLAGITDSEDQDAIVEEYGRTGNVPLEVLEILQTGDFGKSASKFLVRSKSGSYFTAVKGVRFKSLHEAEVAAMDARTEKKHGRGDWEAVEKAGFEDRPEKLSAEQTQRLRAQFDRNPMYWGSHFNSFQDLVGEFERFMAAGYTFEEASGKLQNKVVERSKAKSKGERRNRETPGTPYGVTWKPPPVLTGEAEEAGETLREIPQGDGFSWFELEKERDEYFQYLNRERMSPRKIGKSKAESLTKMRIEEYC